MSKEELVKLEIIDIDHEGLGIAKLNNKPVFIDNALPNETVLGIITRETKNLYMAKNVDILTKSSYRQEIPCEYYKKCGGCNMLHFSYEYQLEWKKKLLIRTLKKVGNIETKVNDVIKNDNIYHYRNKIIVPLADNGSIISGFYKQKTHEIVAMDKCLIEPKIGFYLINEFKRLLTENNISIYDEKTHQGLVRNIMIRVSSKEEVMLTVIATSKSVDLMKAINSLIASNPSIVSAYLNINNKVTNVVLSNNFIHLSGQKELIEEINGLKFLVGPNSFLQVNHKQCEKLYQKAIDYLDLKGNENVIDAYCGIGTISLSIASTAKHVYGIEIVPEAIKNANNNKILNNITNVDFIVGKCEDEIIKLVNKEHQDILIVDPPRKGCEAKFLETIVKMKIPKIVYISCNPATLSRDARYLIDNGYDLKEVTPVDLFSHTSHIECVALFLKNNFSSNI